MNVYPAINAHGIITQFPYGEIDEFVVPESTLDCGISWTWADNTFPIKTFTVNYPLIQRAEVTVIEDFYASMRGNTGEFQFTDDSGFTWNHCRFDTEVISTKYNEPGSYSVVVKLTAPLNAPNDGGQGGTGGQGGPETTP
jgi:hypothetical protein